MSASTLDDQAVQDALDRTREYVRGEVLTPLPTYLPDGTVEYHEYVSAAGSFESDVTLMNAALQELTPNESDVLFGRWSFTSSVLPPVRLFGRRYDLYEAAASVMEQWAAREALSFDATVDGQSLKRSQKHEQLKALAAELRRQARPRLVRQERDDAT